MFMKSNVFQLSHRIKTFTEANCTDNIVQLEKRVSAAATFKSLWVVSFQSMKTCYIRWSVWVIFAFLEVRRLNRYCF